MKLEDAIIQIGIKQKIKIAKLFKPANMCYDNPSTGLEIKQKPVEFVIKDCALMAKTYIPVEVFCKIENPITHLRGNITDIEIKQFATEVAEGIDVSKRVLYSMIFDYNKMSDSKKLKPRQIEDVYGDYADLDARSTTIGGKKSYEFTDVVSVLGALLL